MKTAEKEIIELRETLKNGGQEARKNSSDQDKSKWLCQDCLAVTKADNEPLCRICSGETCGCSGCENTIRLLENGVLDYRELGLQRPIKGWTENGLVK